jgi:hypothetical protein
MVRPTAKMEWGKDGPWMREKWNGITLMGIHMCINMYVYIYIYVYIHIFIHLYMYK